MYFSEPVLFDIPVLPRIKKYVSIKLQDAQGAPRPMLVGPQSEGASLFLWALSQSQKVLLQYERKPRPGHLNRQGGGRNLIPDDMTQRMGVGIQEFHQSRHQYLLNAAELVAFSNFVDYIIRNEMVLFCEAAPDIEPMRRIKTFVDRYDFSDEDCNEQTLRQAYLRHRRDIKASSFSVHVGRQLHFHPLELAA